MLNKFRDKLNKPVKIIITVLALSALTTFPSKDYPPITKSLAVIIPIIIMVWIWSGSKNKTKKQ